MDQDPKFAPLPCITNSEPIHLLHDSSDAVNGIVLIFHGITGTPSEVGPIAQYLFDRGFHVLAPRLAGHGTEIRALSNTRLAEWKLDIERVIRTAADIGNKRKFIIGQSFGALLALYCAQVPSFKVAGLALSAPPIHLASALQSAQLQLLSFLPERFLSMLGTRQKRRRKVGYLAYDHSAYSEHSIGGLCRLMRLRREVLRGAAKVSSPLLVIQDPFDHHLTVTSGLEIMERFLQSRISFDLVYGAEHEIFLGHKSAAVCDSIFKFFMEC